MSVESWDPNAAQQQSGYQLEPKLLHNITQQHISQKSTEIRSYFEPEQLQIHAAMMKLGPEDWLTAIASLEETELHALLEILTLAEMQIPGWEAGEESPVIYIVKYMRKNNMPLNKERLQWIRNNSTNRFLPNGPL